mmetsp:Transcript_15692/g.26455  ORF Transcript_15692/g.26455 Transcript_15692/m.26455 type:complete len:100 (-) Transcript_15692:1527-1826(-)
MWNGFPGIPLGTLHADGHVHYIALAIMSAESAEFYGIYMHSVFVATMLEFPEFDGSVAYGMSDNGCFLWLKNLQHDQRGVVFTPAHLRGFKDQPPAGLA